MTDGDRETSEDDPTERGADGVALIGHRGCAAQYPENTVAAIQRAAPHVDAVEIDVRRCGSGELVVCHDAELDRLTEATGRVADADWDELRELTVLGSEEPIPRLGEALAAVPDGTAVNVELKAAGVATDALEVARDADAAVWFSSFLPGALETLRDRAPGVDRALLVADGAAASAVDRALELDCAAVHPAIDLATEPGYVEAVHEAGLAVNAWTAVDGADAARVKKVGCDGVIADRWDVFEGRD